MSQGTIAAIAVAVFVGFFLGYLIGWRQGRRVRLQSIAAGYRPIDSSAYVDAYRAELERVGASDIEARVRRFRL